jgi:hypothetical protein
MYACNVVKKRNRKRVGKMMKGKEVREINTR